MFKQKRNGFSNFKLEDRVTTPDIKSRTWKDKGTIIELVPSADLECCSFAIKLDKCSNFSYNLALSENICNM